MIRLLYCHIAVEHGDYDAVKDLASANCPRSPLTAWPQEWTHGCWRTHAQLGERGCKDALEGKRDRRADFYLGPCGAAIEQIQSVSFSSSQITLSKKVKNIEKKLNEAKRHHEGCRLIGLRKAPAPAVGVALTQTCQAASMLSERILLFFFHLFSLLLISQHGLISSTSNSDASWDESLMWENWKNYYLDVAVFLWLADHPTVAFLVFPSP